MIGNWVTTLREEIPVARKLARALARGRTPGKLFKRDHALNARARALVAGYGFQVCWDF